MESNTISLKTFSTSLAIILFIETGLRLAISDKIAASLPTLGIIRCGESVALIALALRFEGNLRAIGLSRSRILAGIIRGALWSACFGIAAAVLFLVLMASGVNALELMASRRPSSWQHIVIFFWVGGVIGPIAEEVFFRGIVFGFFRRWGAVLAVISSTLIFVATHPLGNMLPFTQIVGGIVFAIAYEKEKNLMVPITIHCLGNLAIFSLALFA